MAFSFSEVWTPHLVRSQTGQRGAGELDRAAIYLIVAS